MEVTIVIVGFCPANLGDLLSGDSLLRSLPPVYPKASGLAARLGFEWCFSFLMDLKLTYTNIYLDLRTGGRCLRPVLLSSLRFGACGHLSRWGLEGRKGKLQNLNFLLKGEEIKERSCCCLSLFGDCWVLELFTQC